MDQTRNDIITNCLIKNNMNTTTYPIQAGFDWTEIDFGKMFSELVGVWGNQKYWLTRNYFFIKSKIKVFIAEIGLYFHFM